MTLAQVIEMAGKGLDGVGVIVVVVGIGFAAFRFFRMPEGSYRSLRQDVGRAILLGLELLVAADIIRTVAVTPSLRSVGVLGLIVLIRTFLSFTLEVELDGRWPWQRGKASSEIRPS